MLTFNMFFTLTLISLVILSAILSNKILKNLGIPTLLFFLILGMTINSIGLIRTDLFNFQVIVNLTSLALSFIIFHGGFCTKWKIAKPIIVKASILSTLGVFLTAIITGFFCYFCFKINILECLLIGSVIASTDAASVFSILRSKNSKLKENTGALLEIESGSNDPMSYVLVILAISLMQGHNCNFITILFFKQIIFGCICGYIIAKFAYIIYKKTNIIIDGNDSLFIIALVLISYALAEKIDGNPFLSTYFLGIILGNYKIENKMSIYNFFDGITKLAQLGIFFVLGLYAIPLKIISILFTGSLIFLFLTLIARPVVIFLLLKPFKATNGQIILTSWAGLRGVASIVFAIIAMNNLNNLHYDLFHLVFLISILSVSIQGTFLFKVANYVGMIDFKQDIKKTFNEYKEECVVKLAQMTIPIKHSWIGKKIKDIKFPDNGLVLLINRGKRKILPQENTIINSGDKITLSIPCPED